MQMCPNCDYIYDESDYSNCPRCDNEDDIFFTVTDDEDESEAEEGEMHDYTSELGVTKTLVYEDGQWRDFGYTDPGWDYVYDEDDSSVSCPTCGADELRYHQGQCCCIECDSTFSDSEIEDYAGPWHI